MRLTLVSSAKAWGLTLRQTGIGLKVRLFRGGYLALTRQVFCNFAQQNGQTFHNTFWAGYNLW